MPHRLARFLRRHHHAEEVAAEAIGLDLLWTLLRIAGVFGAGFAAAAITSSSSHDAAARVQVAARVVLETPTQRLLVAGAHRYGPGSGLVYVWGGSTPFGGFDCSGFVYYLYRRVGITIPRDSRSQWTSTTGVDVARGHERPGDVVFFHGSTIGPNAGPPPGHEGIYIGGGRYIDYYATGRPAEIASLADARNYMGAKRWWQPITVDQRDSSTVIWFARYFHVRVAGANGRIVTFKPWAGHGRFSSTRRRQIVRWAHHHHHATSGNRGYLRIHF